MGVGTITPVCAVDFQNAGDSTNSFLILPKHSNATRAGLNTVEGAFIYNTDNQRPQFFTGTEWRTVNSTSA